MAEQGLRVIALAYRPLKPEWRQTAVGRRPRFLPGSSAWKTRRGPKCRRRSANADEAGIRVIMVTGDHPHTARAIAREIGLVRSEDPSVITGEQLRHMSPIQLRLALDAPELIFARVSADQKMRIVEALKQKRHVVAVTGDGVNDAPALKSAHIGIAMGIAGTDVAKEAADMVLLDDNFASIVNAVEEGRAVFENIRKFLTYILAHNVAELIPYLAFVLFKIPLPLTPIQILAIDMGTDSLTALGLGVERPAPAGHGAASAAAARAPVELAAGAARLRIPGNDRSGRRDGGLLLRALRGRLAVRPESGDVRSSLSTGHHRLPERDHRDADRQRIPLPKHDPIDVFSRVCWEIR